LGLSAVRRIASLLLLLAVAPHGDASGVDGQTSVAAKKPAVASKQECAADAERFCPGLQDAGLQACLFRREDDLADECWQVAVKMSRFGHLCTSDLNKYCRKGPKTLPSCLQNYLGTLSPGCRSLLEGKRVRADGVVYSRSPPAAPAAKGTSQKGKSK
jgi:hypothetical protein